MAELRSIEGWREVAPPSGAAITTLLRVSDADREVLDALGRVIGSARRRDLRRQCEILPGRAGASRGERQAMLRDRKRALTSHPEHPVSARWANAIIRHNDDQAKLARTAQRLLIDGDRERIRTIADRLGVPCGQKQRLPGRRKATYGYKDPAERAMKQRRLQIIQARLTRTLAEKQAGIIHVVEGGRRLLRKRANAADPAKWRREWDRERGWFEAVGSRDEAFGNATIQVLPDGTTRIALPAELAHLSNGRWGGRAMYRLDAKAAFPYRGEEWAARIASGDRRSAVTYRLDPLERRGWRLTASWGIDAGWAPSEELPTSALGIDLNADHLACWRLDRSGNPVGAPIRIRMDVAGKTSGQRQGELGQAVSKLVRIARERGIDAIIIEDLGFADARDTGRETMGRGRRGKKFRRTVAGIGTAKFKDALVASCHRHGVRLIAVNPAYTSKWGGEHWAKPTSTPRRKSTRHEAAALVIGRRGMGLRARRRARKEKPGAAPADARRRTIGRTTTRSHDRTTSTDPGEGRAAPASPKTEPSPIRSECRAGRSAVRPDGRGAEGLMSNRVRHRK